MTRSIFEEELRKRIERPPPPEPFTREITSVDEELERCNNPRLNQIVKEDREKNKFSEETIIGLLYGYEKDLGIGLEEQVRRDMGVPKDHENKPWDREDEVRKRMGLPLRKGTEL